MNFLYICLDQIPNSCKHKFASLLRFLLSISNKNALVSLAYNFTFAFGTALKYY